MPWKLRKGLITKIRNWRVVLLLLIVWSPMGCERPTKVEIKGGTAPVFVLSGSGKLAIFAVYGQDYFTKAEKPFDENFALWEIMPSGRWYSGGTRVEKLGSVTYGVVPPGYEQVKPQAGSPPPLTEGQKYFFHVDTTDAVGAAGFVEITNSRAVPTEGEGPCFGLKDGKWFRAPCANR